MKAIARLLLALGLALPAAAEIEKVPTTDDGTLSMRWWPKVTAPRGWKHDRPHSVSYGINALAPEGKSFAEAPTIMYARAIYKPREMQLRSVEALMERDQRKALARDPGMKVAPAPELRTADGKRLRSVTFAPSLNGSWERVAYGEEGDFYILFAVSSRTEAGYRAAMRSFESLVRAYREKPRR